MFTPKVTPVSPAVSAHPLDPSVGDGEMIVAAADPSLDTLQGEELLLGVNQYS